MQNYVLPAFLIDPKYRIFRHLLFLFLGVIITFNQVFIAYQDSVPALGDRIYFICISSFILYVIAIYFNYYYLIRKFLLKEKYMIYSLILLAIVFLLPTFAVGQEYWIRNLMDLPHRINDYTSPLILIDNLASCMIILICFFGTSMIVLLRQWSIRNEEVKQMEYQHVRSEINKVKGQITPEFLSKILNNTSVCVKKEPTKATEMLLLLGQLLRYQLYDSTREKVLLTSEINFINNFLSLEQLNNNMFRYEIITEGNLNNVWLPPLFLLTIIEKEIQNSVFLYLNFKLENESLLFQCNSEKKRKVGAGDISLITNRLDLLYPGKYLLYINDGVIELKLDLTE